MFQQFRRRMQVILHAPAESRVAGVRARLYYPSAKVQIPGGGDEPSVRERITGLPEGFLSVVNDEDGTLTVSIVGTHALPQGPLFGVELDRCKGAPRPVRGELACRVEDAASESGVKVEGATCSVAPVEE